MKPRRLIFERLDARLALSAEGLGLPPGAELAVAAAPSPCDLECKRTEVLATLDAESAKRVVAVTDLSDRFAQAGGDLVETQRLGLWISGWNQYGQTLDSDIAAANGAQTLAELAALEEKYRLSTTGLLPLTEMGNQTHLGFSGGLYPGGTNARPAALETAALARAHAIVPLNAAGQPDPANGRVVLVSIGMSNTNQEFGTFISKANAYPGKNSKLSIINGAQGGRDADDWIDPAANTWSNVDATLSQNGLTPEQVQVAWVKQARAQPNQFGSSAAAINVLRDNLEDIARNLKIHYPNIQIAYISSRTRAYTDVASSLNPEPFAYESGFAVQQLIARQIAGTAELNADPARGPVVAPILLWGPYIWADGTQSRTDGFASLPHDVGPDRTHPATSGREKVAYELLKFFTTDSTAVSWFAGTPLAAGDLNQDGQVALDDLWMLQRNLNRTGAGTAGRGDLNGDQRIDRADVARFASQLGETSAAPAAIVATAPDAITGRLRRPLRSTRPAGARLPESPVGTKVTLSRALSASRTPMRRSTDAIND